MFCSVQKPSLLILANIKSNKWQEKETLRFSHRSFAYMHLSKREVYHSYKSSTWKYLMAVSDNDNTILILFSG